MGLGHESTKAQKNCHQRQRVSWQCLSCFRVFVAHCFYRPDRVQVRQDPRALAPPRGQCRSSRLPAALAGDRQLQRHRPRGGAKAPRVWRDLNSVRDQGRVYNARAQRTPRLSSGGSIFRLAEAKDSQAESEPWRSLAAWRCFPQRAAKSPASHAKPFAPSRLRVAYAVLRGPLRCFAVRWLLAHGLFMIRLPRTVEVCGTFRQTRKVAGNVETENT